jgi:hypothetical protein
MMNERGSRKIPVTERQFLWVQDDDKGEVTLHVGPTMVSPTAADRIVIDDGNGGFCEDLSGRPQQMIEVGDNQYAVLANPLTENDGGPNGRFRTGRNEARSLRNGTRAMIPGPCSFYLRPGQRCEVRDAHELSSNQYIVVKVYGPVDDSAPYYDVTVRSAAITRATAEKLDGPAEAPPPQKAPLVRGQLIVIRGIDTQFYIPPSGVDIVPDTSIDESGASLSAAAAQKLIAQLRTQAPQRPAPQPAAPPPSAAGPARRDNFADEEIADDLAEAEAPPEPTPSKMRRGLAGQAMSQAPAPNIDQSARGRMRVAQAQVQAPAPAARPADPRRKEAAPPPPQTLEEIVASDSFRKAVEREAQKLRLVRNAVVLGEKEYCVLLDPDGKREIKVGPARVFPGPYDTFMIKGSRNRVYDAYELLPQRALWLRVISTISRAEMAEKMPRGVQLDKEFFYPGDELLLTGVSGFFFPFNEIEILSPRTGEALVGNDRGDVFIEAIGIDQKSGIYVRDLTTGEVRLVRGKQSYLVDPRKEVHITRTISAGDWNLWIAPNEPHKVTGAPVTTPWAVSITVPHNTAIMATSAAAQRIIEGPCVTLLEYEETLVPLRLSTGTPKADEDQLTTCYLRTVGNRVSDVIEIETADFVSIHVRTSYSVTFQKESRERWFNCENYIQVMCDHLRSIVRSRTRTMSLSALWPQISQVVRDTILGPRQEGEGGRKGRFFPENGMLVTEVEVLEARIKDQVIAEMMQTMQRESVTLAIGDRRAQDALASAKLRAELERQTMELQAQAKEREAQLKDLARRLEQQGKLSELREREAMQREQAELQAQREAQAQAARLQREAQAQAAQLEHLAKDAEARATAARTLHAEEIEHQEKVRQLEILLIEAQSKATVAERQAVQPRLVEALTALGDKGLLAEVAQNMNLVSLFRGKEAGEILREVLGGTRFLPALEEALGQKKG